ncbi:MAG: exo-alpha-sialidase [Phycisphaerae bacterium]
MAVALNVGVAAGAEPTAAAPSAADSAVSRLDLFAQGQEGYRGFRIPALVVTNKGTVLAICEGRKKSLADSGNIDLVIKRSLDGGKTWDKMRIIVDDGDNTAGNPCPVVDRDTGTIWLPFCRNNKEVFVTHSTDDGVTWAEPVNITREVSRPRWSWYATGPGHGIQLRSGRLLIPCDHKLDNATKQQPHLYFSHVIYSDDHGKSWKLGGTLGERTNECQAIETEDGQVYLNMRSYHDKNRRAVAWSRDGGLTFSEVTLDETLIEPKCQASLLRLTDSRTGGRSRVLFSNPASTERKNMTVRLSYDDGKTWPVSKVLNPGKSVYSELAAAPDGTILCLYENGEKDQYEKITLARFSLSWLTDGKDTWAGEVKGSVAR